MTKLELAISVMKRTGLDKKDIIFLLDEIMETVKTNVAKGENVYLRGFGSFIVKKRAAKRARNITKDTSVMVSAHNVPVFKPAKIFKEAVKKLPVEE